MSVIILPESGIASEDHSPKGSGPVTLGVTYMKDT